MAGRLPFKIEICVENADGVIAAQNAGADRAELCASLLEGGLTPSFGMVGCALRVATIPFHVIVRPRGGDFLYSEIEFEAMRADVRHLAPSWGWLAWWSAASGPMGRSTKRG